VFILPFLLLYIPDFAVIDDVVIAGEEAVVVAVINRTLTQRYQFTPLHYRLVNDIFETATYIHTYIRTLWPLIVLCELKVI